MLNKKLIKNSLEDDFEEVVTERFLLWLEKEKGRAFVDKLQKMIDQNYSETEIKKLFQTKVGNYEKIFQTIVTQVEQEIKDELEDYK